MNREEEDLSGRIRLFWVVFTALFAALAVLACVYSSLFGSIWNRPEGDPAETVTWFFDSIRIGNYPSAYSCLSDYVTLGLEQEPETPEARKIYDVLKKTYTWSLNGSCRVSGLEAVQPVSFRVLNMRVQVKSSSRRRRINRYPRFMMKTARRCRRLRTGSMPWLWRRRLRIRMRSAPKPSSR